MKKLNLIICIGSILFSTINSRSQEPAYPIILVHGLASSSNSWIEAGVTELFSSSFGWGNFKRLDICLNADADNTRASLNNDVKFFFDENNISAVNLYLVNFDINPDGTKLFDNDVLSNQAAITKQGVAIQKVIETVLRNTGKEKVILIGHSMGGLAIREYVQTPSLYINGKHHVAKLITIGTPNLGSNTAELLGPFLNLLPGQPIDFKSEAVRDLRYHWKAIGSVPPTEVYGTTVYLFGGNESEVPGNDFYNIDVNCDGIAPSPERIVGLNEIGLRAMPEDIDYVAIVGNTHCSQFGDSDLLVRTDRQVFPSGGQSIFIPTDVLHSNSTFLQTIATVICIKPFVPSELEQHKEIIEALDEPDESNKAYKIELNKTYNGFTTFQSENVILDTDWFIFNSTDPGVVSITVSNVTINGTDVTTIVQLFDKNNLANPLTSGNNSGGLNTIQFNSPILQPGEYYLKITGTPNEDSWRKPYTIYLNLIGAPKNIIVYASPSAILADGTSSTTISTEIQDDSGNLVPTATNEITFNITSGSESAQLIGSNPINGVNGVATISLQSTITPGIVTIEASSPGLTSSSTSVNVYASGDETEVSGTISSNTTWSLANSPYRVTGDVTVAQGATLTIEPGVLVKFNSSRDLFVNGRLVADGLPNQRIAFTSSLVSPSANAWGGIRFNYSPTDSPSILNNCTITYGGQGGFGNLDAPIIVDARANPQITNTSLSNNRYNGINLITGSYSSDVRLEVVGIPYVLRSDLTIASGAVLTVDPGVLLKFASGADFYIQGALTADGNPNSPIIFTSLRDDTRGGDTGGDGSTVGSLGDWGGIWFDATINDTKSILRYCEIYFGGQGGYGNIDSPISLDARANPTITNTILSNNRFNGLNIKTGNYSSNIILDITGLPYMIRGDLTVASGAVLTIQPGVLLKFASGSDFYITGGLTASGTPTNHIVFTSFRDDSHGGDTNGDGATAGSPGSWGGIRFGETTDDDNAILRYCEIYFGGQGGYGTNNSPLVLDARANPTLEGVTLADNLVNGIWLINQTYSVNFDLDITNLPYILGGDLTVGASAQLTIHPGTLFKMASGTDFFVDGTLRIIGQENRPVVFTSFKDDSRGGDTDGTGATSGVPGDWGGIQFRDPSSDEGSVIEYSEFHFGGQGGYGTNDSPLVFDNANPKIQNVLFSNTKSHGVHCVNAASPDLGGGAKGSVGSNSFIGFLNDANKYAIFINGSANVYAKLNHWESADPNRIDQMIFDFKDNSGRGQVFYEPIGSVVNVVQLTNLTVTPFPAEVNSPLTFSGKFLVNGQPQQVDVAVEDPVSLMSRIVPVQSDGSFTFTTSLVTHVDTYLFKFGAFGSLFDVVVVPTQQSTSGINIPLLSAKLAFEIGKLGKAIGIDSPINILGEKLELSGASEAVVNKIFSEVLQTKKEFLKQFSNNLEFVYLKDSQHLISEGVTSLAVTLYTGVPNYGGILADVAAKVSEAAAVSLIQTLLNQKGQYGPEMEQFLQKTNIILALMAMQARRGISETNVAAIQALIDDNEIEEITIQEVEKNFDGKVVSLIIQVLSKLGERFGIVVAEHGAGNMLSIIGQSPIDLVVTDPEGFVVSKNTSEIPKANYIEADLDGDEGVEDKVIIFDAKPGTYSVTVIPDSSSSPNDTYSLYFIGDADTTVLAQDEQIQNIPPEPYSVDYSLPTSVSDPTSSSSIPEKFALFQNYPNPFNPSTRIEYQLPKPAKVTLRIYNIRGQEVRTLVDEEKLAGYYSVQWDGLDNRHRRVSSGVYVYRIMISPDYEAIKKMLFLQ